jgi:uncharacterized protein
MAPTPTVRHDDTSGRYELVLDDAVIGYADHRVVAENIEVFPHTVIEPAHQGQGMAAVLVQGALDDVRSRGVQIVPSCWYVAQWIERNPDYTDLVAPSPTAGA